ncbi:MAG TPA: hypothetical protein VGL81_01950 [Polyangiaceae bacterium]
MALFVGVLVVVGGGCVTATYACPGGCPIGNSPAAFDLSCNQTDLTSVVLSGPCATGDTSPSRYLWSRGVSFTSPSPGVCHVELVFATGFTYSRDVTFTVQSVTMPPGCAQCPSFIAPTQGFFTVDNPSNTCVDAGLDAESDGSADAATCPPTASQSVACASPGICSGCRDNVSFECTCADADASDADGSGLAWQCIDIGMPCSP